MNIRVVLGDDNVLVREGVRALLETQEDIEVVGMAQDAPSLLAAAAELVPDVVVTDIKMPPTFRLEGIEAAHDIRSAHPATGVVVLSAHDDEDYALALLGKGETGLAYLLKDRLAEGEELVRAIREVHAGGSLVDPTIAARLAGRQAGEQDRTILDLMAAGAGYAEMAEELGTTQEGVDHLVTDLFRRIASDAGGGAAHAVDGLKLLHAAVVEREHAARSLRRFVSPQVAEQLAHAAPGERPAAREIEATILFSDIRGFSTLAEDLTARQLGEVVGRHFEAMVEVIAGHGGTLDKFAGDAVMALFGVDGAPDHAAGALRCALEMQRRQEALNGEGWPYGLGPIGIGIGVNTGSVLAGTVGGGERLEFTVIGDAVNVAQRLQSEAAAGEVLASAATVALAPDVRAEPIGARTVKGRHDPVEVYRVLAPRG